MSTSKRIINQLSNLTNNLEINWKANFLMYNPNNPKPKNLSKDKRKYQNQKRKSPTISNLMPKILPKFKPNMPVTIPRIAHYAMIFAVPQSLTH